MVFYFTSNVVSPAAFIYVGKDKVESQRYPQNTRAWRMLTELETRT